MLVGVVVVVVAVDVESGGPGLVLVYLHASIQLAQQQVCGVVFCGGMVCLW